MKLHYSTTTFPQRSRRPSPPVPGRDQHEGPQPEVAVLPDHPVRGLSIHTEGEEGGSGNAYVPTTMIHARLLSETVVPTHLAHPGGGDQVPGGPRGRAGARALPGQGVQPGGVQKHHPTRA